MELVDRPRPRVIAVASGKGGTGKSFVAANLATFLATLGKRVVLVDAAVGSASLHDFVGAVTGPASLGQFLLGGRPLAEVARDTPLTGLRLISGDGDPAEVAEVGAEAAARLGAAMTELDADYVVVDLPSGTGRFAIELFLAAPLRVLCVAPEPTAVEQCYRFIRIAYRRAAASVVDEIEAATAAAALGAEALALARVEWPAPEGGIAGPADLAARAASLGPRGVELLAALDDAAGSMAPFVLLNGVRSKADMDLGAGLVRAAARRLGVTLRYLGHVEYDDAVWVSLRRRRPLLVEHPESRAARGLEKITRRLLAREAESVAPPSREPETHYQLLDIEPTASEEDIRRAYRRVRQIYGRDSVLIAGLYARDRLEVFHRRLDEAYSVLMDPGRRKAYDVELYPDGVPTGRAASDPGDVVPPGVAVGDRPAMPVLAVDTDFTGELLQRVRESRGLELREISDRTKVGMGYLAAIEEEAFGKLPAPVYVRGFLAEYAKMLGLDAGRVLETYFERFRRSVGERAGLDD